MTRPNPPQIGETWTDCNDQPVVCVDGPDAAGEYGWRQANGATVRHTFDWFTSPDGTLFDPVEADLADWNAYWAGLSPEERLREREMIDAYTEDANRR